MSLKPSKSVELLVKNIGKKTNIEFYDVINLANLIITDVANQSKILIPVRISNQLNSFYAASCLMSGGREASRLSTYKTFNTMFDVTSDESLYGTFKYLRDELNLEFYTVSFNTYFEEMEPLENLQLVTMVRRPNY